MSTIVFPALPGLDWSVFRRPNFTNIIRLSDSDREVNTRLSQRCFYDFELGYAFLRSKQGFTDVQQIQSLFLKMRGDYDAFLFEDPNDKAVTLSQIGTGDAANKVFVLGRNTGANFYEAVGYLNTLTGVYLSGVLQSGSTYTFTVPNVITFNTAPGAGIVVTATFSYYYVCRFKDNAQQYEQFMNQLTKLRSVRFKSVVW
jgi:hypothetical protein